MPENTELAIGEAFTTDGEVLPAAPPAASSAAGAAALVPVLAGVEDADAASAFAAAEVVELVLAPLTAEVPTAPCPVDGRHEPVGAPPTTAVEAAFGVNVTGALPPPAVEVLIAAVTAFGAELLAPAFASFAHPPVGVTVGCASACAHPSAADTPTGHATGEAAGAASAGREPTTRTRPQVAATTVPVVLTPPGP